MNNVVHLNAFGECANDLWLGLPNRYPDISLDEFIIMPNHMHEIVVIHQNNGVGAIHELPLQRRNMLLPKIIGYYKMNTSKQINHVRSTPEHRLWQRNYYDHIIRNENGLNRIRKYIQENPLKWSRGNS